MPELTKEEAVEKAQKMQEDMNKTKENYLQIKDSMSDPQRLTWLEKMADMVKSLKEFKEEHGIN